MPKNVLLALAAKLAFFSAAAIAATPLTQTASTAVSFARNDTTGTQVRNQVSARSDVKLASVEVLPRTAVGTKATPAAAIAPSPQVLSASDAGHYSAIFALQDEEEWRSADTHIASLGNRVLLGTVLAQRYLSPSYNTNFSQLKSWLSAYADQPEARAIWALARKRAPRRQSVPRPVAAAVPASNTAMSQAAVVDVADGGRGDALPAAPRSGDMTAPSRFEWALAAWRGRRYADAGHAFEAVAQAPHTGSWYVAAAAFWAARANLVTHRPDDVDQWLGVAAQQPRTFYGLLARRLLGMDTGVRVGSTALSAQEVGLLSSVPAGRRALALVDLGETERAEAELRALAGRSGRGLANAVVALADIANMPALCLALSRSVSDSDRRADALYPMPHWQPRNGYSVDRALMYALMMQESAFETGASSRSGASGLMQLMPKTAKTVAHNSGIHLGRTSDLVDPEINLSLGQEYVKQLIKQDQIRGNLILMLAAYKGGTGTLAELEKRPGYHTDPLMFVESLPHIETRLYVERVLTNMWIYRQRLGQNVPDLDALAANEWPTYVSLDHTGRNAMPALVKEASR